MNAAELAAKLEVGEPTVRDILDALARPGRDPREDLPPPIFKKGVLKLEDITPGMELKGTVLNVVPFGAFVDIGLKESGLVHISQMANRYIKSPYDVVAVGDVITVWVMEVKPGEKKISLSMIQPGQERRPSGRAGAQPRGQHPRARPRRNREVSARLSAPRRAAALPARRARRRSRRPIRPRSGWRSWAGGSAAAGFGTSRLRQRHGSRHSRACPAQPRETAPPGQAQAAPESDCREEVGQGGPQHVRRTGGLLQERRVQARVADPAFRSAPTPCYLRS